jgi:hypothetical protein
MRRQARHREGRECGGRNMRQKLIVCTCLRVTSVGCARRKGMLTSIVFALEMNFLAYWLRGGLAPQPFYFWYKRRAQLIKSCRMTPLDFKE